MNKSIVVYGVGQCDENSHCETISDMLEGAKEVGYSYEYFDYLTSRAPYEADAYIFIHMEVPSSIKKPNIRISPEDSIEDIEAKMQDLADYLDGTKKYCSFFGEDPYEPKSVNLKTLGFDIDYNNVVKIPFDFIEVDVDGKKIKLSKEDIITLGKVYNMINFFGYKIQRVVL